MDSGVINITQARATTSSLAALTSVLSSVVGAIGIIIAAFVYRQNSKTHSSNLLLKLEEHFNQLGAKLYFLEYLKSCYVPIAGTFLRAVHDLDSLDENDRKLLLDVDECIRLLFICALNAPDTLHYIDVWPWSQMGTSSRLPHAYLDYLRILNDDTARPELYGYVSTYFPNLRDWLERNKLVLSAPGMRKRNRKGLQPDKHLSGRETADTSAVVAG